MAIELGLQRITRLLRHLGNPHLTWKTVHVAGTNGKGLVVAYVSLVLATKYKTGRFTSPHLIQKAECVCVNNVPVLAARFSVAEEYVLLVNARELIGATEFEILTATAFAIFRDERVEFAVIEVGLGGRGDATNVIPEQKQEGEGGVICTAVTKIGYDHQGLLGNTIEEIALQKAGITKPNTPMVVDATNLPAVLSRVSALSLSVVIPAVPNLATVTAFGDLTGLRSPLRGNYQLSNLMVALNILQVILPHAPSLTSQLVVHGIESVEWPGRLQELALRYRDTSVNVLLDGAHNGQSAGELATYLAPDRAAGRLTFIIAVTKGKDVTLLLSGLLRREDRVVVTSFGAVDGMPWIRCMDPGVLATEAERYAGEVLICRDQEDALARANDGGRVIVCGSLYLVGDLLRRDKAIGEAART